MERDTGPLEAPDERAPYRNVEGEAGRQGPGGRAGTLDQGAPEEAPQRDRTGRRATLILGTAALIAWAAVVSMTETSSYTGALWLLAALLFRKRWKSRKRRHEWATDIMLGTAFGVHAGAAIRLWL